MAAPDEPPLSVAALDLMMIDPLRNSVSADAPKGQFCRPKSGSFSIRIFAPVIAYLLHCILLAQAAAETPAQPPAPAPAAAKAPVQPPAAGTNPAPAPEAPQGLPDGPRLLIMILITGILFYFIMLRPQKKKEQELRAKIGGLKENERVVTIGGIYGVVTNVQRDAQRVTIRVDESTGTKIRLNMSAIARVVTGEDEDGAAGGTKS